MQAGMLYQARFDPDGGFDLEQLTQDLDEDLDEAAFVAAWQFVVLRHPMLRTRFSFEGRDEPVQETLPTWSMPATVVDWRREEDLASKRRAWLAADRREGFDLEAAPPLRLFLARTGVSKWWACWSFHHILLDGRSFVVVLKDVFAAYEALRKGQAPALVLPPPPRPFTDFVAWSRRQRFSSSLPFWKKLLAGKDAPTSLPNLPVGTPSKTPAYGELESRVPVATATALRALAATTKTTMGTLVQGAWALCLNRLTGDDDVVFGATRAGRRAALDEIKGDQHGEATSQDLGDMVGLFINMLEAY
jgi:hypothetical protein